MHLKHRVGPFDEATRSDVAADRQPAAAPPTHLRVNGVQRALIADAALGKKRYPRADVRHTGGRHNGRPEVKALQQPRARPTVVAVLTRRQGHDAIASALRNQTVGAKLK